MSEQLAPSVGELGEKFGYLLAQYIAENITLQKRLAVMIDNEASLLAKIEDLEDKIARLQISYPADLNDYVNKKAVPVDG